jgi:hypothetical protein
VTSMPYIADLEAEAACTIVLPFPPASLSGHAKGHWRAKSGPTAEYRESALKATLDARPVVPAEGDILLHLRFVPPDNRGDRVNFWNRAKCQIDGIAEALGINDKRFLPSMSFAAPTKPGHIEVTVG